VTQVSTERNTAPFPSVTVAVGVSAFTTVRS
jgi:hypothetical protein